MGSFDSFQVLYSNGAPAAPIRLGQLLVDESEPDPLDMLKVCTDLAPVTYVSLYGGGGGGLPPDGDYGDITVSSAGTVWTLDAGVVTGKQSIWIGAGAILPSAASGSQPLALIASAANQPDIVTLNFDPTTQEYAQFSIKLPKAWNAGTVTFVPVWSHPATTTNFGVVWSLQAVAMSDGDAIAAAYGTAQTSTDTGGTTDDVYIGPESDAITIAGTPAKDDVVFFRLSRETANGSDTLAADARLHGITLYFTTDAATDA